MKTKPSARFSGSLRTVMLMGLTCLLVIGMSLSSAEAAKKKPFTSYYRDATVFRDKIRNGVLDQGETHVTTESDGSFFPPTGKGRLYLEGGSHIVTGQQNTRRFTAPAPARGIGTLTSLWQTLLDKKRNNAQAKRLLGVPKKASVADFSAVAIETTTPPKKAALVKASAKYDTLSQFLRSLLGGNGRQGIRDREARLLAQSFAADATDDALAQELIDFGTQGLDVTDPSTLQTLLGETSRSLGVALSEQELNVISQAASAINHQIEAAPGQLDALLTVTANATAVVEQRDLNTLQTQYIGDGLQQQVTGTIFIPIPTVTLQQTTDVTPTLTGTWSGLGGLTENSVNGQSLTVEINGKRYATANGVSYSGTSWSLTVPAADALAPGIYDVIVTVTDSSGVFSNDTSRDELVIQRAATPTPTARPTPTPTVRPTATPTPTPSPTPIPAPAAPTISNLTASLTQLNDTQLCSLPDGVASLYSIRFQYTDPNGNGPTTLAETANNVSFVFAPSGNSGSFNTTGGSVNGNGFTGNVELLVCWRFNSDTSVTETVTIQDLGGLRSAGVSNTMQRPDGAN